MALASLGPVIPLDGATRSSAVLAAPPDIVVVMLDDMGVTLSDGGVLDNRILERLPNISTMFLASGLQFEHAYGELPLCCPGRAGFLTGQHPRTNGVILNHATLLDPSQTIATVLDDAGYQTHFVGKYLNGAEQLEDKTPPGWDHVAMKLSGQRPSNWVIDDKPRAVSENPNAFTATQAIDWAHGLEPSHPAFLVVTPTSPHFRLGGKATPWLPLLEDRFVGDERCAGIAPYSPPDYEYGQQPDGFPLDDICRSLLTVDEMVGSLRELFASRERDVIFVLTSDNGMSWGSDGWPLKAHPSSTQVPLLFAGPGIVSGRTDALVSSIDVSPTLAELAGTAMPFAEGVSFAPVLSGGPSVRESMFEDSPSDVGPLNRPWWVVRTPEWVLLKVKGRGARLFDAVADPWEENPISNRQILTQLKQLFPYTAEAS